MIDSTVAIPSAPMRKLTTFKLVILSMMAGVAAGIFFFSETRFSLANMSWHYRFDKALQEIGEVKLGALVNFKWDKIYLLEAYDNLNTEKEAQLFPARSRLDPLWWSDMQRYWTIAYQRPSKPPFLIRMNTADWYLRNLTNDVTTDLNAKLRLVPPNTIESTYCPIQRSRCLSLDDSRSKAPSTPLLGNRP